MKEKTVLRIGDELTAIIPAEHDVKKIQEIINRNKEYFSPWLPWAKYEQTEEDVIQNLLERHKKYELGTGLDCYIYFGEKIVASAGISCINVQTKKGEIGYWIDQDFEGRGVITKSVKKFLDYGFRELGFKKIILRCDERNIKSEAVALRLGFTHEKTVQEKDSIGEQVRRMKYYVWLKKEYLNNN